MRKSIELVLQRCSHRIALAIQNASYAQDLCAFSRSFEWHEGALAAVPHASSVGSFGLHSVSHVRSGASPVTTGHFLGCFCVTGEFSHVLRNTAHTM